MKRLQEIDLLTIGDHWHLDIRNDKCYFILEYTARESFNYSEGNRIIANFKKKMEKRDSPEWKYKDKAIRQCAEILRELNLIDVFSSEISFVPIPSSKTKMDPMYDDRLLKTLNLVFSNEMIKDVVVQRNSMPCSHETAVRRDIEELLSNYDLDVDHCEGLKDTVIVFDDVLTTGAHFIAVKKLILGHYPHKKIIGLFLARRAIKNNAITDFDEFIIDCK